MGCLPASGTLSAATLMYSNVGMTAYWCQELCRGNTNATNIVAAVLNQQCHCLTSNPALNLTDTSCETACAVNSPTLCGTTTSSAVYNISTQTSYGQSCAHYYSLGFKKTIANYRLQSGVFQLCINLGNLFDILNIFHFE